MAVASLMVWACCREGGRCYTARYNCVASEEIDDGCQHDYHSNSSVCVCVCVCERAHLHMCNLEGEPILKPFPNVSRVHSLLGY